MIEIAWLNTIAVAVSMAVDCMTVGAMDGVQEAGMKRKKILFIAFVFGLFQFLMPVIGYFIGFAFQDVLKKYIPWIAFALLTFLAVKNIVEWGKEYHERKLVKPGKKEAQEEKPKELNLPNILLQGIATSIDALCIGFVYLESNIPSALIIFGIIGVVTMILSIITISLGRIVGKFLENWAGLLAGIVFFLVGLKILLEGTVFAEPSTTTAMLTYAFSLIH